MTASQCFISRTIVRALSEQPAHTGASGVNSARIANRRTDVMLRYTFAALVALISLTSVHSAQAGEPRVGESLIERIQRVMLLNQHVRWVHATCMLGKSLMMSPSYLRGCRLRAEIAPAYLPRHASDDHYQSLEYPCKCDCKHCLPLSAEPVYSIMAYNIGPLSTTSKHQACMPQMSNIHKSVCLSSCMWWKMHSPEIPVVQAILQLTHGRVDRDEVPKNRKHS